MHVDRNTKLSALLSRHPDIEEVLEWYGFDIGGRSQTLAELCESEGVDVRDLITDIESVLADDDEGEDAWERVAAY